MATVSTSIPSVLNEGDTLVAGQYIVSDDRTAFLLMQSDGNLVLYKGGGPEDNQGYVWSSLERNRATGSYFTLVESDGNVCVYEGSGPSQKGALVWSSGTAGGTGTYSLSVTNTPSIEIRGNGELLRTFPAYMATGGKLKLKIGETYIFNLMYVDDDGKERSDQFVRIAKRSGSDPPTLMLSTLPTPDLLQLAQFRVTDPLDKTAGNVSLESCMYPGEYVTARPRQGVIDAVLMPKDKMGNLISRASWWTEDGIKDPAGLSLRNAELGYLRKSGPNIHLGPPDKSRLHHLMTWEHERQVSSPLNEGDLLGTGDYMVSPGGTAFLLMQSDGNLVLYKGGHPGDNEGYVWSSLARNRAKGQYFTRVETNGNLCVYEGTAPSDNGPLVWSSDTVGGTGPYSLCLTDTPTIEIRDKVNTVLTVFPPK